MNDETTWDSVKQRAKELKEGEYIKLTNWKYSKEKIKTCEDGEELAKALCEKIDEIWDYLFRDDDY